MQTPPPADYDFDLEQLGWRPFFAEQVTDEEQQNHWHAARVCRGQSRRVHVWSQRGTHALAYALFGAHGLPAVGDWVMLDPEQKQPPRRLERFSALSRQAPGTRFATQVLAANVDTLLIVTACNQDFNVGGIERYLALAAEAKTRPVLVLTKADLADNPESYVQQARDLDHQLQIECLDARDSAQLQPLRQLCGPGQTLAALGSSGVGKSTLINALSGAGQLVGEVRGDDNKGKHTTTSRSLHRLEAGGVLIDLPGIRELQLTGCADGIDDTFAEVAALIADCRFNNCRHDGEPGCAITKALAAGQLDPRRWDNYRKLQGEQQVYSQIKAAQDKRENRKNVSKKTQRRMDDDDSEMDD